MIHQPVPDACGAVTRCPGCNARHGEEHRPQCVKRPEILRAFIREALQVEHGLERAVHALTALATGDGIPRRWWLELEDRGVARHELEDAILAAVRHAVRVEDGPPLPSDGRRRRALAELDRAHQDQAAALTALRALEAPA